MPFLSNRIAPLYFHCCLAGHDSGIIFEYVFRLLATEDRGAFVEADPRSKLLLPKVKRGYAETALSEIIEMVKMHTSDATHVEAGGWGECISAKLSYVEPPSSFAKTASQRLLIDSIDSPQYDSATGQNIACKVHSDAFSQASLG